MSTNGISQSASPGVGYKAPHLKCLYTSACSMRNKQEELGTLAQSQRFDIIIIISETWWDESCDWSALLNGYTLFRRDRQGRKGRGVSLYLIEGLECMELTTDTDTIESLWVKIKGKTNTVDVIVGVL
ncbi:mitochondrial fission process protein 1 [Pitangus sulphuratus]|nr:mitochondrial fission process protein 1 [Pitangus sulphuratus]